ncbi:unnamed protein product [Prorocentrum cordatum]|uniref:Uncharacterized protein n=1 Tax=Prorocentrum cordatum TaxID=2364126 RepID=A0ABN9Q906_9DINO|nr:unnamed protein product [Polarella glacialis]
MVDFKNLVQENAASGKQRSIRPPHRWKPPSAPIMEPGPMTCVKVPVGAPGTTIQVPHPKDKRQFISVSVPASAKAGQAMMVPVPPLEACAGAALDQGPEPSAPPPVAAAAAPAARPEKERKEKKGWSTGARVAAGTAGAVAVGGLVVGGAILGEHIVEEGWDATVDGLGDWAAGAGEWAAGAADTVGEGIAGGADAAADWIGGAADTAGDFIMDLF